MRLLEGKVALVTGGNSGIGLATARLYAEAGAQVVITGRRPDALASAIEHIGHGAIAICGDAADPAHHRSVASEIGNRFGRLNILLANAGMNLIEPTSQVTEQSYDIQFATNTRGTFFCVQSVIPLLAECASVIIVSSLAASKVLEAHSVYAGTKAAVEAFARNWASELKDRRIRVNVLAPGPVDTAILAKLGISEAARPQFEAQIAAAIPLGRLGRPEELAQAALFLASDSSSFITGAKLGADGGMMIA
jgi:NAD(P)-dependent dehydrogenase (short-subunit alcohol dehydrogenase family)